MTPRRTHPRRDRGFTLLEVMLAALVGGLMVLAAFAALAGMETANQRLATRTEEQAQLDRAQLVLYRALNSLAMSDLPTPPGRWRDRQPNATNLPPRPAPRSAEPPAGDAPGRAEGASEAQPEPPARFTLRVDPSAARTAPGWAAPTPPQQLELTLTHPPIRAEEEEHDEEHRLPMTNHQGLALDVHAFRGRFELVPSASSDGASSYELWWRPLPPLPVGVDRLDTSSFAERPVRVASGLRWAWFEVFAARRRHADNFSATWSVDLPAYVRFEAMTVSGLYVDWLFELTWVSSPEYTVRSPTPAERAVAEGQTPTGAGAESGSPRVERSARRSASRPRRETARPPGSPKTTPASPAPTPASPPPANRPEEPAHPVPKPKRRVDDPRPYLNPRVEPKPP